MKTTRIKTAGMALAVALAGMAPVAAQAETEVILSYNQPATSAAWQEVMEPYAARKPSATGCSTSPG